MNIHIVHLPHTFPFLLNLSLIFHRFGFNRITLVANGFNLEQINLLRKMTKSHPFISILDVPTKRILSHGEALNFALKHCNDDFFIFADHDIFPTQPIKTDFQAALKENDAVCLGDRPENTLSYKGFAASATQTSSSIPLATSFFSAFHKQAVVEIQKKFNVGFEQYFRKSQLPLAIRSLKDVHELREPFLMDTCKAMSLAFHLDNKRIKHLDPHLVCHLGGITGAINRLLKTEMKPNRKFYFEKLPSNEELQTFYLKNQTRHPCVLKTKKLIADYALQTLINLQHGNPAPIAESEDENISIKLKQIEVNLTNAFISALPNS